MMLEIPFHECLTLGELTDAAMGMSPDTLVIIDGGDDYSNGYTITFQEPQHETLKEPI